MRCTSPRTVGFQADGKTIAWSQKQSSKEFASFQLPCGKCIECRLDYARQWAIRCVHEAQMHDENCFITLTYSDENLKSTKLIYEDFQKFMKRLRFANPNREIGCFVTGEYGDKTKRPHWHALLFNWRPQDSVLARHTDRGDRVYSSVQLDKLWGHGITELGSVTFESAGYCARYAAKKLGHGKDNSHEYDPISKKSSKYAIGKKWLEKNWPDIFLYGNVVLPDGRSIGSIPRYYERWFKENHPEEYFRYVTKVKIEKIERAAARAKEEEDAWWKSYRLRPPTKKTPLTRTQVRAAITKSKFQMLQDYLKLK